MSDTAWMIYKAVDKSVIGRHCPVEMQKRNKKGLMTGQVLKGD